ncbi:MAG TPA: OsmC family protein [Actinomycetota bacterium]|jgi:putative redox protein|nr:OsmC family protein [Actinomycetota bacterium]
MADVRLVWTGDRIQFVGTTGYGEPILVGGDVEGPGAKPSDLLPLSLAACTAYDVVEILRKQRQDLLGLEVVATSVQDPEPPWIFRSIHLRFQLTGPVDASKAAKAVEIAETRYCAVAATIRSVVRLTHEVAIVPNE